MAEAFVYHLQPMVAEMKQGLSIKIIYTDIYRNKHFKKKRNEADNAASSNFSRKKTSPTWPKVLDETCSANRLPMNNAFFVWINHVSILCERRINN